MIAKQDKTITKIKPRLEELEQNNDLRSRKVDVLEKQFRDFDEMKSNFGNQLASRLEHTQEQHGWYAAGHTMRHVAT